MTQTMLRTKDEIHQWLKTYKVSNYEIDDDLKVSASVLVLSDNHLTHIPFHLGVVQSLIVKNNQLTSLPTLPEHLLELHAEKNCLTTISVPTNIQYLNLKHNQIKSIDLKHCTALKMLYLNHNQIQHLTPLHKHIDHLEISHNPIKRLPSLKNITTLNIANCNLKYLPKLSLSQGRVNCSFNPLTDISELIKNDITDLELVGIEINEKMLSQLDSIYLMSLKVDSFDKKSEFLLQTQAEIKEYLDMKKTELEARHLENQMLDSTVVATASTKKMKL